MTLPFAASFSSKGGVLLAMWLGFATLGCGHAAGAEAPGGTTETLRKGRIRFVLTSNLLRTANRADAVAAMKTWCDVVARKFGYTLDSQIEVVETAAALESRVRERTVDVVILESADYFKVEPLHLLEPVFLSRRRKDTPLDHFILLVRQDSGITTLEQLRGKTAICYARTGANYGRLWLDVLLDEHQLGATRDFFTATSDVSKPSAAVLPVFFKNRDACVTDRSGFDLANELNPQVGQQLRVLTNSPGYLEGVICLHDDFQDLRADFIRACAGLHTEPRGAQILLVFKSDQLVPYRPEYLDAVRALCDRHARLTPATAAPIRPAAGSVAAPAMP